MNAIPTLKSTSAAVAIALLLGTVNSLAADGVSESFDRMLAHQPGRLSHVSVADRDADPLMKAVVIPLRVAVQRTSAAAADPVAESFARLFAHTASPHTPSAPASLGRDPLVAAMVEPLRHWLSESTATTQVATTRIQPMER